MAQISERKIQERDWERMWKKLVYVVGTNQSMEAAEVLLGGLLTKTERVMLTKRLMVCILSLSDWEAVVIAERLKLSTATVYKLRAQLDIDDRFRSMLLKMFPQRIEYSDDPNAPMNFLDELDRVFETIVDSRKRRHGVFRI